MRTLIMWGLILLMIPFVVQFVLSRVLLFTHKRGMAMLERGFRIATFQHPNKALDTNHLCLYTLMAINEAIDRYGISSWSVVRSAEWGVTVLMTAFPNLRIDDDPAVEKWIDLVSADVRLPPQALRSARMFAADPDSVAEPLAWLSRGSAQHTTRGGRDV
jgi:hypothetical protein